MLSRSTPSAEVSSCCSKERDRIGKCFPERFVVGCSGGHKPEVPAKSLTPFGDASGGEQGLEAYEANYRERAVKNLQQGAGARISTDGPGDGTTVGLKPAPPSQEQRTGPDPHVQSQGAASSCAPCLHKEPNQTHDSYDVPHKGPRPPSLAPQACVHRYSRPQPALVSRRSAEARGSADRRET